jgi:hypothetical protein
MLTFIPKLTSGALPSSQLPDEDSGQFVKIRLRDPAIDVYSGTLKYPSEHFGGTMAHGLPRPAHTTGKSTSAIRRRQPS